MLELQGEAEAARTDVARLAAGIRPPELEAGGLRSALPVLTGRSGLEVEVEVERVRLRPAAEAAAYFFCAEALTNVAKHAPGATRVELRVRQDQDVVVEVSDDGPGGATLAQGSGLRGLVDRVEALGGSVEIRSDDAGTRLTARLPVTAEATP